MDNSYVEEDNASDVISRYYGLYGQATLQTKIAHVIDGLKCVARRILWIIGTNEKPKRVATLAGAILEKYHPAGNTSIEDAIVRLAQPFNNIVPLISSDTNVGMYGGGRASASRYLDVFAAKFTQDVYFNGIDAGVYRYVRTEYEDGVEPEYLIPKIPMALLTGDFGMAIGHKTEMAMLELNAVCELVRIYSGLRKKYGANTIPKEILQKETAHLMVPDFPVFGLLRNRAQLIKDHVSGNYNVPVFTDGVLEVYPNAIHMSSFPWGIAPGKVDVELGSLMVAKLNSSTPKHLFNKVEFMQRCFTEVGEHSSGDVEASIELTLRRGVSPFEALEHLKKLAHFSGSFTPKTLMIDINGLCKYITPLDILGIWYEERVKSIMSELLIAQNKNTRKIRELEAQIIIIDHTDEVTAIYQKSADDDEASKGIANRFKLTESQARFIGTISMRDLTRKGKDTLIEDRDKAKEYLKVMQERFKYIDQSICDDATLIQKRYGKKHPRKSKYPDFIGAVKINNEGYVQFRTMEDIDMFMVRFDQKDVDVQLFPSGPKNKLVIQNDQVLEETKMDHSREFVANDFIVNRLKPKFTLCRNEETIYRVNGVHPSTDAMATTYIGDHFVEISEDCRVTLMPASSVVLRKNTSAKGVLSKVLHLSGVAADEVFVAYCNTREKNMLRLARVKTNGEKILKIPVGKTEVLGVYRIGDPCVISVPSQYLKRCGVRHVYVTGNELVPGTNLKVDLNKRATNDKRRLSRISKRSHVYEIK